LESTNGGMLLHLQSDPLALFPRFLVAGNQVLSAAPDDGPWAWTLPPLEICDSHYATADLKPIKGPTSEGDHY